MMGRTHALTGWCAGLALAPVVGLHQPAVVTAFAATTAGFALLPDLDHPGARASKIFGPVTGLLSRVLRWCSSRLYRVTKGPRDEDCTGTHRHATHTVLFAALLGGVTAVGTAAGGRWVVLGVLMFGLLLAEDALGDWLLWVIGGAGVTLAFTSDLPAALDASAGWVGVAVAAGCVTHCLGDSVTVSGCPFLFPLPIAGETWYEIRPPRWLRFRTGKAVEQLLVFPVFAVMAVLLLPGVWPVAVDMVSSLFAATPA
jgi:membrane-bound metal-dependent hydrolase YbcI (DUF457 family)